MEKEEEEENQDPTLTVPVKVQDLGKSDDDRGGGLGGGADDHREVIFRSSAVRFACEFCSKVFSSGNALGGHKRIHTQYKRNQRRKKGAKKKRPRLSTADDSSSSSTADDSSSSSSSWKPKGKVEKDGTEEDIDLEEDRDGDDDEEEDEEMAEVAAILLMLGGDAGPSSGPISPHLEEDAKHRNQPMENLEVRNKRNSLQLETKVYTCGTCNRIFTSHHAYGGHMASHSKTKKTSSSSSPRKTLGSATADWALQELAAAAASTSSQVKEEYKRHSNTSKTASPQRHVLNFDLNDPAPEIDQEEGAL
ncbi:hypothetical protein SAY86_006593 [Trapa natans]|uniref:C2H2-type domain-containing protein n=1 Tax=Trapa natans TaxID=22666 RepID=A0AAN7LCE1_TRANT|nr:hypothetical protein SAY86_006593 [Trapa natans]